MKKVDAESTTRKSPLVRGKYTNLLRQGSNIAILDADVVEHFPDSESVNNALRAFLAFGKQFQTVIAPKRLPPVSIERSTQEFEFDPRTGRTDKVFASK